MKLITWNVNSIRARLERVVALLERHRPDVLCLQELKVADDAFPYEAIESAGYYPAVHGQPTYNGVAILAREPLTEVVPGMEDGVEDPQARLIAGRWGDVAILNAYMPNGDPLGSPKFAYKLAWMARLARHLAAQYRPDQPLVLCGDFNVFPDERDAAQPEGWLDSALGHADSRLALAALSRWGLVDVCRAKWPDGGVYTWWDYRAGAFHRNLGLRLDHVFATPPLASRCIAAQVDRDERKGPSPSDHAPVIVEFAP